MCSTSQAFLFAVRLDAMPEHDLVAGLVHCVRSKMEAAALSRLLERPAGKDAGDFGDVLLRVAAVHAEGVQLHQFAAIVFVESAALAFGLFDLCWTPLARRSSPVAVAGYAWECHCATSEFGPTLSQLSR